MSLHTQLGTDGHKQAPFHNAWSMGCDHKEPHKALSTCYEDIPKDISALHMECKAQSICVHISSGHIAHRTEPGMGNRGCHYGTEARSHEHTSNASDHTVFGIGHGMSG
ncbi:hypothetical protein N7508_008787 [Penicillium antarcticum]|uniref:uncharacterized protein n=1 Tax=Penicillium antarcticum TaxID=416450 RepID=UPI002383D8A1|nr:uncharacterized protein N7508_008787 [Penicillium antarcticum]KAJ5293966.1 hypothetical protein N7508_008787 [Penicillium antarcticum]